MLLEPCFSCILAPALCDIPGMYLGFFQDWPHYYQQAFRAALVNDYGCLKLLQTRTMFKSITAFSIGGPFSNWPLAEINAPGAIIIHWLWTDVFELWSPATPTPSRSLPLRASRWMRTECLCRLNVRAHFCICLNSLLRI